LGIRSKHVITAAGIGLLLAVVAVSAAWSLRSVKMAGAEETAARARAFLVSARDLHAEPSPEELSAVLPPQSADGDAGPVYIAALLDPGGTPKPLPPAPDTPVPGLEGDRARVLQSLEHPSVAAVLRGSKIRRCRLVANGFPFPSEVYPGAFLPPDGCRRVSRVLLEAASALDGRGEGRGGRAEDLRRSAAAFGWHLTRDPRIGHFVAGSTVLASAAAELGRSFEAAGDAEKAARARDVARAASSWSRHGRTVSLGLRRSGVTPEGAAFLAEELQRITVPAWRAEGIHSLGSGWCYNLIERKRGAAEVRAATLEKLALSADPGEAAAIGVALEALSADAETLRRRVEEAIR